jgi:hypothetical protein
MDPLIVIDFISVFDAQQQKVGGRPVLVRRHFRVPPGTVLPASTDMCYSRVERPSFIRVDTEKRKGALRVCATKRIRVELFDCGHCW